MNEIAKLLCTGVVGGIIGGFVGAYCQHRFAQKRDREARERTAAGGRENRRREFLGLVADFRAQIEMSDDPTFWVNLFTENAPRLKADFDKISGDLSGADKLKMAEATKSVMEFACRDGGEIYANKDKLLEAFGKFPAV